MRASLILRAPERANTIGFIGLGAMGNHMLNNLVTRYRPIEGRSTPGFAVFDVNAEAMANAIRRHGTQNPAVSVVGCTSPEDVATKASTIISMVPTSKHVRDVYLGERSVMSALQKLDQSSRSQTLCLDQSTIEQSVSREVAQKIREAGANMMDAPVSGGVVGAEKGTLAIMVGGDEASYARSLQVLQAMSRKVTHCGDLGAGLAAKIANKYVQNFPLRGSLLLGITMLGLSEAMLLGKNLGLSPQVLVDIINASTGRCWSSEINNPDPTVKVDTASPPAHRNYQGGFVTALAHKDLALAVKAAAQSYTPLKLGECAEQVYRPLAQSEEWGKRDFSVVYKVLGEMGEAVPASDEAVSISSSKSKL